MKQALVFLLEARAMLEIVEALARIAGLIIGPDERLVISPFRFVHRSDAGREPVQRDGAAVLLRSHHSLHHTLHRRDPSGSRTSTAAISQFGPAQQPLPAIAQTIAPLTRAP